MEKERIKEYAGKVMSDLSGGMAAGLAYVGAQTGLFQTLRSEEHTSELQSRTNLVCRLLLEKKKKQINNI